MDPRVKALWLNALLSGDYPQSCSGNLRTPEGFCVMGLLCELHREYNDKDWFSCWPWKLKRGVYTYGNLANVPPLCVIEWAGLDALDPVLKRDKAGIAHGANSLNDSGVAFSSLAKLIDKRL